VSVGGGGSETLPWTHSLVLTRWGGGGGGGGGEKKKDEIRSGVTKNKGGSRLNLAVSRWRGKAR